MILAFFDSHASLKGMKYLSASSSSSDPDFFFSEMARTTLSQASRKSLCFRDVSRRMALMVLTTKNSMKVTFLGVGGVLNRRWCESKWSPVDIVSRRVWPLIELKDFQDSGKSARLDNVHVPYM